MEKIERPEEQEEFDEKPADDAGDHDGFFKSIYSMIAFLIALLTAKLPPEILAILDLTTLALKDCATLISGVGAKYQPDLAFTCMTSTNEPVIVYLFFEHRSYYSRLIAIKLFIYYSLLLWKLGKSEEYRGKKLPLILPIVVLQGKDAKFVPLSDILDVHTEKILDYIPKLNPIIIDLSTFTKEEVENGWPYTYPIEIMNEYKNEDIVNIFASIFKKVTEHKDFKKKDAKITLGRGLEEAKIYVTSLKKGRTPQEVENAICKHFGGENNMTFDQLARKLLGKNSLRYAMEKGKQEGLQEGVQKGLQKGLQKGRKEGKQEGVQKGLQKGRKEGRQEGRQEGLQESVIRCVSTRFSPPPKTLCNKISRIKKGSVLANLLDALVMQSELKSIENMVDTALQQQARA
ncbi:MAG: Rpn family recombination-promoting nuclease/putative transposase [Desulfovibrio sp.]|nr:Rpn family recombination-promoting nuclease/putative transposase [Desulfovibrio sp.]